MNLHNNLSVTYETQILEDGRVVSTRPAKRNLLLDSGLDGIAVRSFWDAFTHCVLGDGTTPTKRDSGSITVSIASEVATASANYFEAGDVGRLLKLDSGQEVYIAGYTSPTEISVTGASDDSADEATIWYVNETGHANELVRTSTLSSDSGDVSSTWDSAQVEHKRTFVFPVETDARTYKEIGWSHTASSGGNLLGRDLIPNAGDSISPGQQYKVIVKLQVTVSPTIITTVSDVGSGGWDTSGTAILITTDDMLEGSESYGRFEGSKRVIKVALRAGATDLPTAPSGEYFDYDYDSDFRMTKESYVNGSFQLIFKYTFSVNSSNGTFTGIDFGGDYGGNKIIPYLRIKFDASQTKDSDHTLEIKLKQSWGRILTN
jgi:hypothetical protein